MQDVITHAYAGLDVGKDSLTVTNLTESGDEDASFTVANRHGGLDPSTGSRSG